MKPAVQKIAKVKSSAVQLKYEKLIAQIEAQQLYNSTLKAGIAKAASQVKTELQPLIEQNNRLLRDVVLALHRCNQQFGIDKYLRDDFEAYLIKQLLHLLDIYGYQDEKLTQMLEFYAGTTLQQRLKDESVQNMVRNYKTVFGFDIDAEQLLLKGRQNYIDDVSKQLVISKAKRVEQNTINEEQKPIVNTADKALQKQMRNLYMQLVKEFHPDRELDEDLQLHKNEIIKEVTAAYQNGNLVDLLKLSFKYASDGESGIISPASSSSAVLKQYIKILQNQLDALLQQAAQQQYINSNTVTNFIDKNGNFSPQMFAGHKRDMQSNIKALKHNLAAYQYDAKAWFKQYLKYID